MRIISQKTFRSEALKLNSSDNMIRVELEMSMNEWHDFKNKINDEESTDSTDLSDYINDTQEYNSSH